MRLHAANCSSAEALLLTQKSNEYLGEPLRPARELGDVDVALEVGVEAFGEADGVGAAVGHDVEPVGEVLVGGRLDVLGDGGRDGGFLEDAHGVGGGGRG